MEGIGGWTAAPQPTINIGAAEATGGYGGSAESEMVGEFVPDQGCTQHGLVLNQQDDATCSNGACEGAPETFIPTMPKAAEQPQRSSETKAGEGGKQD